jgi:hypothetical protein
VTDNPTISDLDHDGDRGDLAAEAITQTLPYCRTCRRALNVAASPAGKVTYRHSEELRGEPVDHPADPAPLTELDNPVMECDFCSRPDPAWCYLTGDQITESRVITSRTVGTRDYQRRHRAARTLGVTTAPALTQLWGQRWTSCEGCAELIEAGDLYGLISRVTDAMPAKYTRGNRLARVRGELHATFSNVFACLQPGRARITPDRPLGVWEPARPPALPGGEPDPSDGPGAGQP